MLLNEVPVLWKSYPSLRPLASWVVDIIKRIEFIRKWLLEGFPSSYWISGLFFP